LSRVKSNVPWSVKGIDHDARSVAKELARQKGMTLGEWMTAMIKEKGVNAASGSADGSSERIVSGVTTDQLRAVVDTLNRLNERLKLTESTLESNASEARAAMGGLNRGLETMFERVKRLETETSTLGDGSALSERLARLEDAQEKNTWVKSLVALEKALSTLVEQVEASREETEDRLRSNEGLIEGLKKKLEVEDDGLREDVAGLLSAIESTTERVNNTEDMVSQALEAAKQASQSKDETFIERTSQRLQLLGNEIKRTSDQIRVLESSVSRLSEKIEAGEERSAEGISRVAQSLEALRREVEEGQVSEGTEGSVASVSAAVEEADRRVGALEGAFSNVVAKLGGRVTGYDDIDPATPTVVTRPVSESEPEEEQKKQDDPSPLLEDFAGSHGEDEFDRVFDDPLALSGPRPLPSEVDDDEPTGGDDGSPRSFAYPSGGGGAALAVREDDESFPEAHHYRQEPLQEEARTPAPSREENRFGSFFGSEGGSGFPFDNQHGGTGSGGHERFDATSNNGSSAGFTPSWLRDDDNDAEDGFSPREANADGFFRREREEEPRADRFGFIRSVFVRPMDNNPPLGWVVISLVTVVMALSAWRVLNPPNDTAQIVSQPTDRAAAAPEPATPERPEPMAIYAAAKAELASAVSREEVDRAVAALTRAAREGSIPAQYDLGELYLAGEGVPMDPARAREWFLEAASGGHVRAIHRLALLDIEGIGGPISVSDALDRFQQAANAGLTDAMFNLGTVYLPSNAYLPENRRSAENAFYWFTLAAAQGDGRAESEASQIGAQLPEAARADLEARVRNWRPVPVGE
jgi:hypothetical protein